jgi:group I intron endonuclease
MNNCGIYAIKNYVNNKVYIGSSKNIYNRFKVHKSRLNLNKHHSSHLQHAYNLNPADFSFEILELVANTTELELREQFWVDSYKSYNRDFGYNAVRTVDRTSPERQLERWNKPGEKEKQVARMSPINKSFERRKKVSNGLKKHFEDPANRDAKALVCPHRKRIQCIETGEIFNSIAEASRRLSVSVVKIRDSFTGKRKSKNFSFRLLDE